MLPLLCGSYNIPRRRCDDVGSDEQKNLIAAGKMDSVVLNQRLPLWFQFLSFWPYGLMFSLRFQLYVTRDQHLNSSDLFFWLSAHFGVFVAFLCNVQKMLFLLFFVPIVFLGGCICVCSYSRFPHLGDTSSSFLFIMVKKFRESVKIWCVRDLNFLKESNLCILKRFSISFYIFTELWMIFAFLRCSKKLCSPKEPHSKIPALTWDLWSVVRHDSIYLFLISTIIRLTGPISTFWRLHFSIILFHLYFCLKRAMYFH